MEVSRDVSLHDLSWKSSIKGQCHSEPSFINRSKSGLQTQHTCFTFFLQFLTCLKWFHMLTNVDCMRNYNFSINNLWKHLIFINTKLTLGKTWSHLSIRTHKKIIHLCISHTKFIIQFFWIKQIHTKKVYHTDNIPVCYAVMYLVKRFDKEM